MQQGNVLLKKINKNDLSSGMNSLVNEMKNLNKSYSKDSSLLSTSGIDENLNGGIYNGDFDYNDPAFQLDSGSTGELLSFDWWMKDLLDESVSDSMFNTSDFSQAIGERFFLNLFFRFLENKFEFGGFEEERKKG